MQPLLATEEGIDPLMQRFVCPWGRRSNNAAEGAMPGAQGANGARDLIGAKGDVPVQRKAALRRPQLLGFRGRRCMSCWVAIIRSGHLRAVLSERAR